MGFDTGIVVRDNRGSNHLILRGRLGSEIDVMEGDSIVYGRKLSS